MLEPGCGSGHRVTSLAKSYPNSNFTAFDIDAELVAKNSKLWICLTDGYMPRFLKDLFEDHSRV